MITVGRQLSFSIMCAAFISLMVAPANAGMPASEINDKKEVVDTCTMISSSAESFLNGFKEALSYGAYKASEAAHAEIDKAKPLDSNGKAVLVKQQYCIDNLISEYFLKAMGPVTGTTDAVSAVMGPIDDNKCSQEAQGEICTKLATTPGAVNYALEFEKKCNDPKAKVLIEQISAMTIPGDISGLFTSLEDSGKINNYNNNYSFPYKQ
ncbi:MAG: hypothetical protein PHX43_07015 [Alphaproteobacteria bacterium]|nr:hypothetical protein [Alphaproteobacteria bacterium]